MSSVLPTDRSRKRKRDHCSICQDRNRNATGHQAQYCSWPDGPYEGRFKDALKAKQRDERERKTTKESASATGGASDKELQTKIAADVDTKIITFYATKNQAIVETFDRMTGTINDQVAGINEHQTTIKKQTGLIDDQAAIIKKMQVQIKQLHTRLQEVEMHPNLRERW
jgi:hypothetical protein